MEKSTGNRSSDDRSPGGGRTAAQGTEATFEEITLHGHRVTYRRAGWGPVILLLHGVAGSSETWAPVIEPLAERYTVVVPDLIGHGESAKPRGDYSLGAFASGIRDLLQAIGHDTATVVGHSLGGGIAMQMAYQFPDRCERLLLGSGAAAGRVGRSPASGRGPGAQLVVPPCAALEPGAGRRRGARPLRRAHGP